MKFQKIVIAILSLLLIINTIGIGVIIKEEKDQTEIALYTMAMAMDANPLEKSTKITKAQNYLYENHKDFLKEILD